MSEGNDSGKVAFVFGGGGLRGGYEVGMLRALIEAGVKPDLVVGTSIGSVHGMVVASDPTIGGYLKLVDIWREIVQLRVIRTPGWQKALTLARTRTHLASPEPIRELMTKYAGEGTFEDLPVPFHCVAAGIERASARWFDSGPLIPAVMASCAVPGMWPPVKIGDEHFVDGGLVESIPIGRAVEQGATTIYVMHAGRINAGLTPPKWIWQGALISLEIARRQRFFGVLQNLPEGVDVHILPTGDTAPDEDIDVFDSTNDQHEEVRTRIENAYRASSEYLAEHCVA